MGITNAVANATSGLAAASRRADIVSNNVANALTPGYAKRSVEISEKVLGGRGAGVKFDGVARAVDHALTRERRLADGAHGRDQIASAAYASFNKALGEPGDPFSLFAQYENFESSLRALAQSPESQPMQAQVLDAAKALTAAFRELAGDAQAARQDADAQIAESVTYINGVLKQIENLNSEISTAGAGGRDATALEDQRKTLIDQVAAFVPVREVRRDNGKVDLITDKGIFLIAGKARAFEFTPTNTITPDATLAGGDVSGLTLNGADLTPGGGGSFSISGGALAGYFNVRDEIAPQFQTQLDALARDVMERFEGIDPSLAPGEAGLFTDAGAAFDAASETGLAARIAINAAIDPDQGGAPWRLRDGLGAAGQGPSGEAGLLNMILDAFTALKAPPPGAGLSGQLSAVEAAANVASSIGRARLSSETQLATTAARARSLGDAEQSATAVDTDVELQKLLMIEQAFSANARVIQTADDMMRTLLEL